MNPISTGSKYVYYIFVFVLYYNNLLKNVDNDDDGGGDGDCNGEECTPAWGVTVGW